MEGITLTLAQARSISSEIEQRNAQKIIAEGTDSELLDSFRVTYLPDGGVQVQTFPGDETFTVSEDGKVTSNV